jgi:hypothetical protein
MQVLVPEWKFIPKYDDSIYGSGQMYKGKRLSTGTNVLHTSTVKSHNFIGMKFRDLVKMTNFAGF